MGRLDSDACEWTAEYAIESRAVDLSPVLGAAREVVSRAQYFRLTYAALLGACASFFVIVKLCSAMALDQTSPLLRCVSAAVSVMRRIPSPHAATSCFTLFAGPKARSAVVRTPACACSTDSTICSYSPVERSTISLHGAAALALTRPKNASHTRRRARIQSSSRLWTSASFVEPLVSSRLLISASSNTEAVIFAFISHTPKSELTGITPGLIRGMTVRLRAPPRREPRLATHP